MNEQEQAEKIPLSFIALMAVLMSLTAISIDAMLPALGQIGEDLAVQNPNDVQLVISSLFVGLAIGILFSALLQTLLEEKKQFI